MPDRPPRARRRAVALALGLATLASTALGGCGSDATTDREEALAGELQAAVAAQGIDIDEDTAIALYGTDGGKVCALAADPAAMEREGLLAHPRFALRRMHVTDDAVAYTEAVVGVYCPDELGNVREYIEGLRVSDEN